MKNIGFCAAFAAVGAAGVAFAGGVRVAALDDTAWSESVWLSAADAPVATNKVNGGSRAADGTSWFVAKIANEAEVKSVKWMTAGLGVYELHVNGERVGDDFLKPGFTHWQKTKYSFTYDVTDMVKRGAGEENSFAAEVSSGWWRDKIVTPHGHAGFVGKKSAFRGVLEYTFADGSKAARLYGTDTANWRAGTAGPVTHAGIFDGEEYDARIAPAFAAPDALKEPERNFEFAGMIFPTDGAEVALRRDLALKPVEAYTWKGVSGESADAYGKVIVVRRFAPGARIEVAKGETLVLDFGQNAAAVPSFRFSAKEGTLLTVLPAEMLNDENGLKSRGNDGPEGSVYRVNLREGYENGRLVRYTFAGRGVEEYMPRFTFFGYRYASVTATDDVAIESVESVPVSSVREGMEIGKIETGDAAVNKLISNVRWGQLSNYLSVPTDCPQRNERLGWTADTQVFCEAGAYNADTRDFFRKWMRDMRDSQHAKGGFPGVAPLAQYGASPMRVGWADAGVVVPYRMWLMFGDARAVDDNWDAMERFMARVAGTKYRTEDLPEAGNYQWNDWLSLTRLESCPYKPEYSAFRKGPGGKRVPKPEALFYWDYLGGCHWLMDARMMAKMAAATGRADAAEKYGKMARTAKEYLKGAFFDAGSGTLAGTFDGMQTPALFALALGLVEGEAKDKTLSGLKASFAANGGTFHTGFLGTPLLLDVLTENGLGALAYDLLLNHSFPGWLYSVDQGATTIWERWNSYTKKDGFGPVGMNSFNHYAYGAVLAWIYKSAAGIAADPAAPGFRNVVMKPVPDRRLGFVKAEYKSSAGLVRSAWRYEGDEWIWEFEIPEGATATVTIPGGTESVTYKAGAHRVALSLR